MPQPTMQEPRHAYGFSGELRDQTGLLPYGFRTHDPANSRWLSPDPIGRKSSARLPLNPYQLVNHTPATVRDALGLVEFDLNLLAPVMMRAEAATFKRVLALTTNQMIRNEGLNVPRIIDQLIWRYLEDEIAPEFSWYMVKKGFLIDREDTYLHSRAHLRTQVERSFAIQKNWYSTRGFISTMVNALEAEIVYGHQAWRQSKTKDPGHEQKLKNFALLKGFFSIIIDSKYTLRLVTVDSVVRSMNKQDFSSLNLKGLREDFKIIDVDAKNVWQHLRSAYRAERDYFRRGITRLLYDLGFTNLTSAFELTDHILTVEDQRFDKLVTRPGEFKQGKLSKHLDFGYVELMKRQSKKHRVDQNKTKRFYRVFKKKSLTNTQIKSIKKHHRELHNKQLERRAITDRSALPPQEVSISSYYRTWNDYKGRTSNSVPISKRLKTPDKPLAIFFAKYHKNFTFDHPIMHSGLNTQDRQYILSHVTPYIWASLQYGATGRHRNVVTGRHHEHLLSGSGVFSFVYAKTGTHDRLNKRPYARAVIYNYAEGKQKNQSKTHYEWVYQPNFETPGPRQGGAPKVPFDLKAIMIGATAPTPKSQNSGPQKNKKRRPQGRKKR